MTTAPLPMDRFDTVSVKRRPPRSRTRGGRMVSLEKGATVSWPVRRGETVVFRGKTGLIWISMEGDPEDYLLAAGQRLCFAGPGLAVLQGMAGKNEVEWITRPLCRKR